MTGRFFVLNMKNCQEDAEKILLRKELDCGTHMKNSKFKFNEKGRYHYENYYNQSRIWKWRTGVG